MINCNKSTINALQKELFYAVWLKQV